MSTDGVVEKVGPLLRAVAGHEPGGATTSDLARETRLNRSTTHRLLGSLEAQGLVERDPATARWMLGPETFLLGSAAASRYDVSALARPVVHALSEASGESAFFSVLRGTETVCLIREDGSFPLRSHVLHEGIRFPLGVASAGLVILAFLPAEEADAYLATARLEDTYGPAHAAEPLRARLADARRLGYAVNPGLIVEGSWGMGAAVFDAADRPTGALSLTGVEHRFAAQRRPELGRLLLDAAHRLSAALAPGRTR
ncbi:DNA-binding IclR family transcriptional regulator [Mumia flava]|uniref:DNA-binding IclR family transcriptional regulator n=1 Tax=Mumia flava TaxID=1348852 RepID=A0A0B2BT45_9ACTN|nr:IclR family transcriptional regulator [Mumia flava]PJJ57314.1 DNA-binding IclR family transcriptional regulator [Mumia flava]